MQRFLIRLWMYLSGLIVFGPIRAFFVIVYCERAAQAYWRVHQREGSNAEMAWIVGQQERYWLRNQDLMDLRQVEGLARQAPIQVQGAGM